MDTIKPENSEFTLFFYQRIALRAMMRYKDVYVVACAKDDASVLTERGMIQIKDVNPNDRVWSNGEWRTIENVNRKEWHGELVKISADNCFEDIITVTDNHKFLAVPRDKRTKRPGVFWKEGIDFFNIDNYNNRKEFYRKNLREIQPEFVEAKDLTNNDWLLSSIDMTLNDIDYIDLPEPHPNTIKRIDKEKIILDNEFFEWLGIWLAEGSWNDSVIKFTINLNEDRLRDRIFYLTEHCFNLTPTIHKRENHNTQVICVQSGHLNAFLKDLYKCDSSEINQWNKWIPPSLLHCAPSKQLQLVKGWLDGDGYYRICGNSHRYKGTTVSNLLCEGIKICLYRNFINPSITTEKKEGKAKVYNINFNGSLAKEFEQSMIENRVVHIKEEMRLGEYYPLYSNGKYYMRNKIRDIEILPPDDEDVYCLQMDNEIFNLNGVESHNCRAFSKSFISILALILQCIFMPGTKRFICAPFKNQSAQIAKEKINEIYDRWPLLMKEINANPGKDRPGNFGEFLPVSFELLEYPKVYFTTA